MHFLVLLASLILSFQVVHYKCEFVPVLIGAAAHHSVGSVRVSEQGHTREGFLLIADSFGSFIVFADEGASKYGLHYLCKLLVVL